MAAERIVHENATLVEISPTDGAQLYQWGDGGVWIIGLDRLPNMKIGDTGRLVYCSDPCHRSYRFEPNVRPGDRVLWLHELRGGYGYAILVPAVVEKVTQTRVTIRVAQRPGRSQECRIVTRSVKPELLRPRVKPCAELGEIG